MKKFPAWTKILLITLLIGIGALGWAWLTQEITSASISRGFFWGGLLALVFGFGNLRTSYSFVNQNAPSYSTAFYSTLRQRTQLMMSDMAEHSVFSLLLLGSGLLSLVIGFLIWRFG